MKELNPNHPTTQALHDQWHKLCAILVFKSGAKYATITAADIDQFATSGFTNITIHPDGDTITLRLVGDAEAARLARHEGGLPV